MSNESLGGSFQSKAWSCNTLADGAAACAKLAGVSLESEQMGSELEASRQVECLGQVAWQEKILTVDEKIFNFHHLMQEATSRCHPLLKKSSYMKKNGNAYMQRKGVFTTVFIGM